MKFNTTFFLILFCGLSTFAQLSKTDYLLKNKPNLCGKIPEIQAEENVLYLKIPYGSSHIINADAISTVKGKTIETVELVFTTYTGTQTFDQQQLNKARLNALKKIAPEIINNELIEWKLTGQTDCKTAAQGNDFFHGFIITYRPSPTPESREKELTYIKDVLEQSATTSSVSFAKGTVSSGLELQFYSNIDRNAAFSDNPSDLYNYLSRSTVYPRQAVVNHIHGTVYISFDVDEQGYVKNARVKKGIGGGCDEEALRVIKTMPRWKPALLSGKPVTSSQQIPITFYLDDVVSNADLLSIPDTTGTLSLDVTPSSNPLPVPSQTYTYKRDSTLFKIFARNANWEKVLVICDFTSSMAPYTAQLLVWHQLNVKSNQNKTQHFTFFNDGDYKPNSQKPIGGAGGIYHGNAATFEEVSDLAIKTMMRGIGGTDIPENNLEAILEAIKMCPDCKDIVMIADNYATPRDMALLPKVNKPIKVILCGTNGGVNTAYLDIAYQTHGAVYTMEEDIENLTSLNEGEEITIDGHTYHIVKGKFIRVYKM